MCFPSSAGPTCVRPIRRKSITFGAQATDGKTAKCKAASARGPKAKAKANSASMALGEASKVFAGRRRPNTAPFVWRFDTTVEAFHELLVSTHMAN